MSNDSVKQLQKDKPEEIKTTVQNSMKFEKIKHGVLVLCQTFAVPTLECKILSRQNAKALY